MMAKQNIAIEELAKDLDLLATVAKLIKSPNIAIKLCTAATLIRAGQTMRDEFEDMPAEFRSSIETSLRRAMALAKWDKIIWDEQTDDA
jgi:hypothetical protein